MSTGALLDQPLVGNSRRRLRADEDLGRAGQVLELDDPRGGGTGHEQLMVWPLGQEDVDERAVDAGRHPQLDVPGRARRGSDLLDRPLHVRCRSARSSGMSVADEQQEERVASELEDVSAVPLGRLDQAGEDSRDGADELFRALSTLFRQALGQRGEARDVHGHE